MSHGPLPDLTSADLRVVSRWLDDDGSLRILREPSSADLIAVIRAGVESGTIKGEVAECLRCNGNGYEVEERIRAVPEHHPSCVGGSECASTCPVPVPHPELERVPCPSCRGSGRVLIIPVSGGGSET